MPNQEEVINRMKSYRQVSDKQHERESERGGRERKREWEGERGRERGRERERKRERERERKRERESGREREIILAYFIVIHSCECIRKSQTTSYVYLYRQMDAVLGGYTALY